MAKSNNQKAKILYLEKMLRETGEHRVISMQKILENLEKQGIRAERKSIYDDVEVLRSFGMDIRYTRERPGGYYLAGESAGEEQPSEEPGLTAEAKEIHETKDIHETSVTGYRKLLEASAGTIKKEIKTNFSAGEVAKYATHLLKLTSENKKRNKTSLYRSCTGGGA